MNLVERRSRCTTFASFIRKSLYFVVISDRSLAYNHLSYYQCRMIQHIDTEYEQKQTVVLYSRDRYTSQTQQCASGRERNI